MLDIFIEDKSFTAINFTEEKLQKAEYENCNFKNCNFSDINLTDFIFAECNFEDCDFSNANILNTTFRDIKFHNSKLIGLRFEDCNKFLLSMKFISCQINYSSFYALQQKNSFFDDCKLIEVDFSNSDFSKSIFRNCDLSGAIFSNTNLEKTDFRSSKNYSINPEANKIKGAKFSLDAIVGLLDKYKIFIN